MHPTTKASSLSWVSHEILLTSGFLDFLTSHRIDLRDLEISDPSRRYFRYAFLLFFHSIAAKLHSKLRYTYFGIGNTLPAF